MKRPVVRQYLFADLGKKPLVGQRDAERLRDRLTARRLAVPSPLPFKRTRNSL